MDNIIQLNSYPATVVQLHSSITADGPTEQQEILFTILTNLRYTVSLLVQVFYMFCGNAAHMDSHNDLKPEKGQKLLYNFLSTLLN